MKFPINTPQDFGKAIRDIGRYTDGGYPTYFTTADGQVLSFNTAWLQRYEIVRALASNDNHCGWRVTYMSVNWEDAEMLCVHSGGRIESAYAEDGAPPAEDVDESYKQYVQRKLQRSRGAL